VKHIHYVQCELRVTHHLPLTHHRHRQTAIEYKKDFSVLVLLLEGGIEGLLERIEGLDVDAFTSLSGRPVTAYISAQRLISASLASSMLTSILSRP